MDALTKIGMVMLSVILTVMSLELFARLMAPPIENPRYLQISQGYENLAQLLKDKYVPKLAYHDYYLYSLEPASTKTVTFTNYFGARSTPDSVGLAEADELIWMVGGSTMQNLETEDRLSIANQMAVELIRNTVRARVLNFGVGSFQSSMEAIKFQDLIRRVPINEIPTTVIFY